MSHAGSIGPRELTRGQRDAANLYVAHSSRLRRDVEIIGPASYEFWLLIEWDLSVSSYCERPNISTQHTRSTRTKPSQHAEPDFWIKEGGAPYFVQLASHKALVQGDRGAWLPAFGTGTAEDLLVEGLELRWIPDTYLRGRVVGIRNRKHLIHYVTEYDARPKEDLYDQVYDYIASGRSRSWLEIEQSFQFRSTHSVRTVIAKLIFDGKLRADLETRLVSFSTVLENAR